MDFEAPADVSDFDEAATWFLNRVPMTRDEWDELSLRAQRRAFTVSGVTQADVLNDVFKAIDRAISVGVTLGEFRKSIQTKLEDSWQGTVSNPSWRTEVIFRNNVQSSYNAGRIKQMRDPDVADVRPYWMFDAILDARVSEICEPLAGTVLPMNDPWWKTHTPPLHHACRSGIRSLRESQARKRGITTNPPKEQAAKGFGLDPTENEYKPDLNRYPNELKQYVAKRLDDIKESQPKPPPPKATALPRKKAVGDGIDIQKPTVQPIEQEYVRPTLPRPAAPKPAAVRVDPTRAVVYTIATPEERAKLERVNKLIASVHSSEIPTPAPVKVCFANVKKSLGIDAEGAHVSTPSSYAIFIGKRKANVASIYVHEFGHHLDKAGLKFTDGAVWAKNALKDPRVKNLRSAIRNSEAFVKLESAYAKAVGVNDKAAEYVEYLSRADETFSRAYTQYIALKTQDKALLREVQLMRKYGTHRQWEDDDFKPIADAFDAIFEAKKTT